MTKNISKSIKDKLLNIARAGKLDYQLLVIRFLYERLLYRLSRSAYKKQFYLKGGVLLYAMEKEYARPTLDIDFLGLNISNDMEFLKKVFKEHRSVQPLKTAIPHTPEGTLYLLKILHRIRSGTSSGNSF